MGTVGKLGFVYDKLHETNFVEQSFLEKLIVAYVVKKFMPSFLEPEDTFPVLQEPTVSVYSKPHEFSPYLPTSLFNIHFNIILSYSLFP
jgi:hypothetical protein